MFYTLANKNLEITVNTLGAEPISLRHCGTERLWQNENGTWAGHAPVLFPVCGNCLVQIGGKGSPLFRHGFARRSEFTLAEIRENYLRLELVQNDETKALYPFDFCFSVAYTLDGDTLEIAYKVENTGNTELPFSWGGHVSHALFSPLKEHFLTFSEEEVFTALLHDGSGLLTGEIADMGRGKLLLLDEDVLSDGNTVIFGNLRSGRVTLHSSRGPLAMLVFEGFENLLLWRPNDAKMLCIEPWANLPDRAGEPQSEFFAKRGVIVLSAGMYKTATQKITYYEVKP